MSDVTIIEDPAASMLLEPIKMKILDLLNKKEMTISEISRELKTNKAKISYHMKLLRKAGLVVISLEEERKGMHYKYFRAVHKVLIPDIRSTLNEEKKFAMLSPIKTFIEGYLAGAGLIPDFKTRERLFEAVSEEILAITSNFSSETEKVNDSDEIRRKIYATAVKNVLNQEDFVSKLKRAF
ncbi:MAG: ArsR/SmtB family transcription factor [Candidatus Heimdallarchaeota archaeon]